jgi:hypothetical protein
VAFNGVSQVSAPAQVIIPADMSNEELNEYLNDNIDNQTIEEEFL